MHVTFHFCVALAFRLTLQLFLPPQQAGLGAFSGGVEITQAYFTVSHIPVICQHSLTTARYSDFDGSQSEDLSEFKL